MTDPQPTPHHIRGAIFGLTAAVLFGVSPPLAKVLLGTVSPVLLAGLLYSGAAAGLWLQRAFGRTSREAQLKRSDVPKLAAVVVAGGVIAPVLMLLGLHRVSALSGSLLLNLEAPLTVLLAVTLFGEHLGRHAATAVVFVVVGAVMLSVGPGSFAADSVGVALLAAACACWALDNNLTQRLSMRDPFATVRLKTLVAGVVNTALGLAVVGGELPAYRSIAGALLLGSVSYGASVVLDAYALRWVGAARESAYFATAPVAGVLGSILLLGDTPRWFEVVAMVCMAVGVLLLLREHHSHRHSHDAQTHEHLHEHDDHHQHAHDLADPAGEPHSHRHHHAPTEHEHPHLPDIHHRHRH